MISPYFGDEFQQTGPGVFHAVMGPNLLTSYDHYHEPPSKPQKFHSLSPTPLRLLATAPERSKKRQTWLLKMSETMGDWDSMVEKSLLFWTLSTDPYKIIQQIHLSTIHQTTTKKNKLETLGPLKIFSTKPKGHESKGDQNHQLSNPH